jgi:hypothetical protein
MFNNSTTSTRALLGRGIRKIFPEFHTENGNSLEIASLGRFDLLIFAGMSMTTEFVRNNGRTILDANRNGASILGLGTGAASYSEKETLTFSKFFNSLENSAIITRDSDTYKNFSSFIPNIYPGIDSAFFLPDYFTPAELSIKNFDVFVFDNMKKPKELVDTETTIYTHHNMWGPLPRKYTRTPNTLVSDVPEDYLNIYANCNSVYSDRVHACVASLAYGNAAKLFTKSPRKALFREVGAEEIGEKLITLDQRKLQQIKYAHLQNVQTVVTKLIGA